MSPALNFRHVDVFADAPFSGNGLIVFFADQFPLDATMAALTREVRQFESVFLVPADGPGHYRARIFTMNEELPFAGHPILGAAAALHDGDETAGESRDWIFELGERTVDVRSWRSDRGYSAEMAQGRASNQNHVERLALADVLGGLGLGPGDMHPQLEAAVVSTGLPYLIVPVRDSSVLASARIGVADFEQRLSRLGSKFAYVLDADAREGRTWENDGSAEDSATGSAAGPVAAYLVACGRAVADEIITILQGRFVNRPSRMFASIDRQGEIKVRGNVVMIASGSVDSSLLG